MKKILIFVSIIFLLFMGVWALFGKSSSEFLRDIKIIVVFLTLIIYVISLVVIAVGEKNVVNHPLAYVVGIAFIAGFISGFLMFKSFVLIALVVSIYVGIVVGLQYKYQTFTNKIYKDKNEKL